MAPDDLLNSLRAAVAAAPHDRSLQLHLCDLLIGSGQTGEAITLIGALLGQNPLDAHARAMMARALEAPDGDGGPPMPERPTSEPVGFDWSAAEHDLADAVPPMFVDGGDDATVEAWDVERVTVKLSDVGGMTDVKDRLNASFIAPLKNEKLRALYGKNLRGGLLLYGPPGCGKSFIARALAGELDAAFLSISIHDVLDMWIGKSERNLHDLFEVARRRAPTVIFIDELDALGRRRSQLNSDGMRTTVNQLLMEMDGVDNANENVFVLGATNHPWDIDVALRRPGRFDRMLLVLPPDAEAREAIFRTHLAERPIEKVNLHRLAGRSDGFTGADIAHVCELAAERAMMDAVRSGNVRMIGMADLEASIGEVRPSAGPWFEAAKNVVSFANADGSYDDLLRYMKKSRLA